MLTALRKLITSIHIPKWLAAWGAAIGGSLVETVSTALSTPGFDPLSLLTWKTLILLAIKTAVIKTVLWLIGLKKPASADATPSPSPAPPAPPAPNSGSVTYPVLALLALSAAALLTYACSAPNASAALVVKGPMEYASMLNPGDTLQYTLSTSAVPGATGYKWTVTATATNGTWVGLPTGSTSTAPSLTFSPSAPAWDSVTFSVTVVGTSANRSSKASSAPTTWRVYRYLPAPVAVTVDSSHVGPLSLILRSQGDSLNAAGFPFAHVAVGESKRLCAFVKFGSGDVAPADTFTACGAMYVTNYSASRRTLSPAEASWMAGNCNPWATCIGLGSMRARPDALVVHLA